MEPVVVLPAVIPFSVILLPLGDVIFISLSCFNLDFVAVYHVGPSGWKKLSGDDVGELHYSYYPVEPTTVEQEMAEVPIAWGKDRS